MKNPIPTTIAAALLCVVLIDESAAQNNIVTYQGRVRSGGSDFTGTGQFKFALVTNTNANHQAAARAVMGGVAPNQFVSSIPIHNGGSGYSSVPSVAFSGGGGSGASAVAILSDGVVTGITVLTPGSGYSSAPAVFIDAPPPDISYVTYWSNDGTSTDGSEPDTAVAAAVDNGLFTVRIGDADLPNMMAIGSGLFQQPDLELRIWFDDGVNGFGVLSPTQPLTATPYALRAMTVDMGTISNPSFIGTTTTAPLELFVNNQIGLRLEYPTAGTVPNLAGGYSGNSVGAGTEGAVIAGGGSSGYVNSIGADSDDSAIGGGHGNKIAANSWRATIAGGSFNDISTNSSFSAIGGGNGNNIAANSLSATIAGGWENDIRTNSSFSAIGGGWDNNIAAYSLSATIAGGYWNDIWTNSHYSAIGGGYNNNIAAYSLSATIAGGWENDIGISSDYSAIGGGYLNKIATNANFATIAGGAFNSVGANANYAFAAGNGAKANHPGSFVWADTQVPDFSSARNNQFSVRADGGAYFSVNESHFVEFRRRSSLTLTSRLIHTSTGAYLSEGGAWSNASDEARKENFEPVDAQAVLQAVSRLPLRTWNYKIEADATRHIGPTAQDFQSAFGFGGDDKAIATVDADGVALAAIQGLNQKLEQRLQQKDAKIAKMERSNAALEQRLAALERIIGTQNSN